METRGAAGVTMDGRNVVVYRAAGPSADDARVPVVYSNDYFEAGEAVLSRCEELGCRPFHLVTVSGFDWDECLSPWSSEPVVGPDDHFTGEAPAYLEWLTGNVVPHAEDVLGVKDAMSYLVGYSMAGLFALWSLYETRRFSGVMCASGSLWYPGFEEFAMTHEPACTPRGIYLSLGDQESSVANPALRRTEGVFRKLDERYRKAGIPSTFELNPGDHYRDADLRMAKGITWLLERGRAVVAP